MNKALHQLQKSLIISIYNTKNKGGEKEVNETSDKELISITIDKYTDLQRIKIANGDTANTELDYQIKITTAKLASLGVNVEDITQ